MLGWLSDLAGWLAREIGVASAAGADPGGARLTRALRSALSPAALAMIWAAALAAMWGGWVLGTRVEAEAALLPAAAIFIGAPVVALWLTAVWRDGRVRARADE